MVLKVLKIIAGVILVISATFCIYYTTEKELKDYNDEKFNIRYYGDSFFLLSIAIILFIMAGI